MATVITRTVNDTGDTEYTEAERNLVESGLDAVMLPFSALSESDEYINKQTAGMAAIGFGIGGFVAGDMFGDRVPLLGQRR